MSKYTYNITIGISRKNTIRKTITNVPYYQMPKSGNGDTICYNNQKIVIKAERNGYYTIKDITENKQNSLYIQIEKALLYLFISNKCYISISRISIVRQKGKNKNPYPVLTYDRKHQLLPIGLQLGTLPISVCDIILQQNLISLRLRNCLIHYLCGITESNRYLQFERLWRAFEQSALWHSQHGVGKPNDFAAMRNMRQYIITSGKVMTAIGVARTLKNRDLDKCRWREMVKNEFPTTSHGCGIYVNHFVLVNTDKRLIKIIKSTFSIMESSLSIAQKTLVNNHITQYKLAPERKDEQVLAVLLCRYAYFLRNIAFHGEVADFSFSFSNHTTDDEMLDTLNNLLRILVFELFLDFDNL